MERKRQPEAQELPAGQALRHGILNKITPILLSTDFIGDIHARSTIKESCLDVVALLEELIKRYRLDHHLVTRD
ncbi:MAG: hypothetical protein J5J00_13815 [Deltaproteobacteria bacterium]|nr:hypothetical protein [Deltaproteobacteria bacterium]